MKKKVFFLLSVLIAIGIVYLAVSYVISFQRLQEISYWERRIEGTTGLQTTAEEVSYNFPFKFELSGVELSSPVDSEHHFSIKTKKINVTFSPLKTLAGRLDIMALSLEQPFISSEEVGEKKVNFIAELFLDSQLETVSLSSGWVNDNYFQALSLTNIDDHILNLEISDYRLEMANFSGLVVYKPETKEVQINDFYFNFIDSGKIIDILPVEFFGIPLPERGLLSGEIDKLKITEERVSGSGELRFQGSGKELATGEIMRAKFNLDYASEEKLKLGLTNLVVNNRVTPFTVDLLAGKEDDPKARLRSPSTDLQTWLALLEPVVGLAQSELPDISGLVHPVDLTVPIKRIEETKGTIIIENPVVETEEYVFQSTVDTGLLNLSEGNLEIESLELISGDRILTVGGRVNEIFKCPAEIQFSINTLDWPGAESDYFLPAALNWPEEWLPDGDVDLDLIYRGQPDSIEVNGELNSERALLGRREVKNLEADFAVQEEEITFSKLDGEIFGGEFECELEPAGEAYNLSGYLRRLHLEQIEDSWLKELVDRARLTAYFNQKIEPGGMKLQDGSGYLFGWNFIFNSNLQLEERLSRVWEQIEEAVTETLEPGAAQEIFEQIEPEAGKTWSDVEGPVNMRDGTISFDGLQLVSENYELWLSGGIDLDEGLISLDIEPRIVEELLDEYTGSMAAGVLSGPLPVFELRGSYDGLWQINSDSYRQELGDEFEQRLEVLLEEDPSIIFREILGE